MHKVKTMTRHRDPAAAGDKARPKRDLTVSAPFRGCQTAMLKGIHVRDLTTLFYAFFSDLLSAWPDTLFTSIASTADIVLCHTVIT